MGSEYQEQNLEDLGHKVYTINQTREDYVNDMKALFPLRWSQF